jgi:two-component system, chemotaxis family, chemotaxis protein CheY
MIQPDADEAARRLLISPICAHSIVRPSEMTMNISRGSHILIVDNNDAARGVVRKLLNLLGFASVDEASDGAAALAKLSEKPYGLVISDWNLEPMDARALLKKIRANKQYADLPFIAMAAKPAINKVVQAKNAGVTAFISKPFNAAALKAKISEINAA